MGNGSLDHGIASDSDLHIYGVTLSILTGLICSFGALTNILNVVVFSRQGLADTVTVTFFALSIVDVGVTITMFGVGLCFSPLITEAGYPVNTFDLSYIIGWTHIAFSRVSSGMTTFVSFERCLCIAMPLKVKRIITLRRTYVLLVVITLIMTMSTVPVFYTSRMAWVPDPVSHQIVLQMVYTDDRSLVDSISFGINTVFLVPGIFVALIIFTVILIINLIRKAKWRRSISGDCVAPNEEMKERETLSVKDRKAIKMVAIVSVVFIVCYAPGITTTMTAIVVPDFNVGRREQNILFITGTLTLFLESINSCVSIFIYFNMSSKFKKTFYDMVYLCRCRQIID